ncbi:hypothetical protein ACWD26_35740 [Streptomyces sp. NPDC002787]
MSGPSNEFDELPKKERELRRAVIRRSCVAGVAALSLTLLSACSDAGEGGSDSAAEESKAPALSAADLEKAALKDGDVEGHKVTAPTATVDQKDVETDSEECAPVAYAMVGSVVDEPSATVQRETASEIDPAKAAKSVGASGLDTTRVLLRLSAYDSAAAQTVMKSLNSSAKACAEGFKVTVDGTSQDVTKVSTATAPQGADEAIALDFLSEGGAAKIPMKIVVFRKGSTLGYFTALNIASAATGKDFDFPTEVTEAQLKKLR